MAYLHELYPNVGEVIKLWPARVWGYSIYCEWNNKLLWKCSYPKEIPNDFYYARPSRWGWDKDYRVLEIYIW